MNDGSLHDEAAARRGQRAFRRGWFAGTSWRRLRLPLATHGMMHVCVCLTLLGLWFWPGLWHESSHEQAAAWSPLSEEAFDEALQRAATNALGGREGTMVVLEAQTGRVRAVVNPRLAFAEPLPPGSTMKPFTMLAALRAGVLHEESRLLCHGHYERAGFEINCSHPRLQPPFNPTQALAYSCNYYFSKLGEELNEATFNPTLASFGFGARSGADMGDEAAGALPHGAWQVASALGEGSQLLVTPMQLLTAYSALFNGGQLFEPRLATPRNFSSRERARIEIRPAHRALLLQGLRGAIAYGTAARAGLETLPLYVFGKTGTTTATDDFRATQGWFVGFAADSSVGEQARPESVQLAVLVYLKRANGAECAKLSRPVFETYARLKARRAAPLASAASTHERREAQTPGDESPVGSDAATAPVRVRLLREDATLEMPLDDYVFGVLAAEASTEDEFQALKAQAVISRTFALKNLRRHARDNYDFCNSTHCQRYLNVRDERVRADFYELLHHALDETAGEILRDRQGRIADVYFSAACGGVRADIKTLWGVTAPDYLHGGRDDFCVSATHTWTDTIPAAKLAEALRADRRTDVGARLDNLRIVKRDASGRAAMILLEGERRRLVRGWDFKIIAGRTLGWNLLKSTRFEVTRAGMNFVFRGRGFGHGLGLCQAGAHVMARRGAAYRQILHQYLPGTSVTGFKSFVQQTAWSTPLAAPNTFQPALLVSGAQDTFAPTRRLFRDPYLPASPRRDTRARLTMSSEHFRVSYPARFLRRDVETVLRTLEGAHADLAQRLASASVKAGGARMLDIFIHNTTGDFVGATGEPPWVAGITRGRRIELQPLDVLRRRGVLARTLRHEYVHTVTESLGRGRTPRWLTEGLAAHVAGEGAWLLRATSKVEWPVDEIERRLAQPASAREMEALYAAAYREVLALIRHEGEAAVWRRVAHSSTKLQERQTSRETPGRGMKAEE